MIEKLTFSVLVDNQSGVLQRVASLFSRRGYNINSLTVSETEDPAFSRMTVVSEADQDMARQIEMQLLKLEIVKKVELLTDQNSVSSELLLIKVRAKGIEKKNALPTQSVFHDLHWGKSSPSHPAFAFRLVEKSSFIFSSR